MIHLTMRGIISDAAVPLREEHRAATRRRILQAVIERLAEDHPAGISMPAVARHAGISVATLYRYFPSKEKLLDGAAQFRHEIVGHAPLDVFAPEPYLRVVFRELVDNRPLVLAQHSSPAGRQVRQRRAAARQAAVAKQLEPLEDRVGPAALARLQALVLLLISSSTLLELHDHCGVDADTAAERASWAIQALIAATVAGSPAAPEAAGDYGHERSSHARNPARDGAGAARRSGGFAPAGILAA